MYRILLIEDDASNRRLADGVLSSLGHEVVSASAADASYLIDQVSFDVVVASVAASPSPAAPPPKVPRAVVYLSSPYSADDVGRAIAGVEQRDAIQRELDEAHQVLVHPDRPMSPIVGRSSAMLAVLDRLEAITDSDAPVLLTGESGTGKDLLARSIHERGGRRDQPLVAVNCAAFPETLLEAELFGYERGAFTGALQRRDGRFRAADRGTLFLDEINGLSLAAQAKLLRVLQDGSFQPLGTNTTICSDVRIIATTNRPLRTLVAERSFREDLYYRINVLEVEVPPLRDRDGDLALLVEHFLIKYARADRPAPTVSPRAWAALGEHSFPGNVRELEHAIQRALVLARGDEIDVAHLPRDVCPEVAVGPGQPVDGLRPLSEAVHAFEQEYVQRALRLADGNKTRAAQLLGISRKNLWQKLNRSAK